MPDVAELKPCPRCGNTKIAIRIVPHARFNMAWAECVRCGLRSIPASQRAGRIDRNPPNDVFKLEIYEEWNRRATNDG